MVEHFDFIFLFNHLHCWAHLMELLVICLLLLSLFVYFESFYLCSIAFLTHLFVFIIWYEGCSRRLHLNFSLCHLILRLDRLKHLHSYFFVCFIFSLPCFFYQKITQLQNLLSFHFFFLASFKIQSFVHLIPVKWLRVSIHPSSLVSMTTCYGLQIHHFHRLNLLPAGHLHHCKPDSVFQNDSNNYFPCFPVRLFVSQLYSLSHSY